MMMMMMMIMIVMIMMIERKILKTYNRKTCDDRINVINILKLIRLHYLLCLNISL